MAVRTRTRQDVYTGYRTEKFSPYTTISKSYISNYEQISDETGGGDNAPLTITRVTRSGGLINGVEASNLSGYRWNNFPCGYFVDSYTTSPLSISGQPTDGALATETLSRTNPTRSSMSALENLADLGTLGGLAKNKMAEKLGVLYERIEPEKFRKLRTAAKLTLLYNFGLMPLISDLQILLQFQALADKRAEELERLRTRGLKRTIHLWSGSNTATVRSVTLQSQGVTLKADITKTTTRTIRGHARWYAYSGYLKSDASVRAEARRIIGGSLLDPQNIYELMPWSWLIDYFTNLGDVIGAANNMSNMYHDAVRIMEHTRTRTMSTNHTRDNQGGTFIITCSPLEVVSETKTRRLANPTLNARIELLTPAQWSILGSLAVLRGR